MLTIVIGVFLMVVIANHNGMVDGIVSRAIDTEVGRLRVNPGFTGNLEEAKIDLRQREGLTLPFFQKHVFYTYKALFMNWGEIRIRPVYSWLTPTNKAFSGSREMILKQLPNTLLLSGVAYLLLGLIGIPLALFLSQREGHWLDRIMAILTPVSSVPSWVLGVLLVIFFAVELRLFPVGRMTGTLPLETTWERITTVAYHMVLPVTAIFLSMFFNLVYNWRTYLLINSDEDYVTLGKAQGLKRQRLERLYILKPVLPYMLTSIVLTFVGFWQTITALEYFFQWPGIGKMYVDALPNFRGETMYYGEMGIVIGIVVLFAYFLGFTLILLDFAYVLVDPRLRVEPPEQISELSLAQTSRRWRKVWRSFSRRNQPGSLAFALRESGRAARKTKIDWRVSIREKFGEAREAIANFSRNSWREIRGEPLAIVGLVMVAGLIAASIVVLIKIPYDPIGQGWARSNLTGKPTRAKLALPGWINWFRKDDLPSTIVLDSTQGQAVSRLIDDGTTRRMQMDFSFDYPYQEFPSEIALYVTSRYDIKKPLIAVTWITPDGRVFPLKNASVDKELTYLLEDQVPFRKAVSQNKNWQKWFVSEGNYPTPAYYILFADPELDEAKALRGTYGLRIEGYLFEENSGLDVELVVFGQVEGLAGTDNLRRDLLIPLLWGLPFALIIGIVGAVLTTILSLIVAATSAWSGGWIDAFMQGVIEANLVLPVMAIGVLLYAYYGFNLWLVLGLIVLLNVLGAPTKAFRAAFLQVKESAYVEAARAYGAGDLRIITRYLIPRILPVMIPQIVILIPNFFFLEATLAIFSISDNRYPTWGRIIYDALQYGATYGSRLWVLQPIVLMLVTGLSFVLLGFALNRMLNPRMKHV